MSNILANIDDSILNDDHLGQRMARIVRASAVPALTAEVLSTVGTSVGPAGMLITSMILPVIQAISEELIQEIDEEGSAEKIQLKADPKIIAAAAIEGSQRTAFLGNAWRGLIKRAMDPRARDGVRIQDIELMKMLEPVDWFLLTVDYHFSHQLQKETEAKLIAFGRPDLLGDNHGIKSTFSFERAMVLMEQRYKSPLYITKEMVIHSLINCAESKPNSISTYPSLFAAIGWESEGG